VVLKVQRKKIKKIFFALVGFGFALWMLFGGIGAFCIVKHNCAPVLTQKGWILNCIFMFLLSIVFCYWTFIIKKNRLADSKMKRLLFNIIGFGCAASTAYSTFDSLYHAIVGYPILTQKEWVFAGVMNVLIGVVLFYWTCLVLRINSPKKIVFKNLFFGFIGFGFAAIMFFASAGCLWVLIKNDYQSIPFITHLTGGIISLLTSIVLTYWTYLLIKDNLLLSKIKKCFFGFIGFGMALYLFVNVFMSLYCLEMGNVTVAIIWLLVAIVLIYWTCLIIKKK